ncbi:alpha/beta hydrolase [Rhizobium sp. EC-SD404]|uniref:alpha/beta hydrolase n=1 Tax=Rhizobium sp. EC-SD404 TaxID=2038389 RepID=UPI001254275F|nr:alpha/beta hydrolase [Rhizobium sp. EC-SD404]VVT08152.1 Alpha/beta hydrolase [Rhizobium sp. EC-SD404]
MTRPNYPITNWDDAYTNGAYIDGAEAYPDRWAAEAAAFRAELSKDGRAQIDVPYGPQPRNLLDLFLPVGAPKGLVVFVHGGYWKAFDKSFWSHLARGAVDHGFAVALPSYTLAPDARLTRIGREVAAAIGTASKTIAGPIRLAGHSAGGHLVSRMVSENSPLAAPLVERVEHVVSISGVHDLRPLMLTEMNAILAIDEDEAYRESPALLRPLPGTRLLAWVGAKERPEFLRQSRILPELWDGFGVETKLHVDEGTHHFDVIDGLALRDSALTQALLHSF